MGNTYNNIDSYPKAVEIRKKEKPNLDLDINQFNLANFLEISNHHFPEILHHSFEQNFYNFTNSYRINEAKK